MGASILPVTIYKGKIYFLFGKERDIDENPGWSDFGGGTDNNETYFQTAVREGSEELTGFLGDSSEIKNILNKYGTYIVDYKSLPHSLYRCHICPIKYDYHGIFEYMPYYYNNNQSFLQKRLNPKIIRDTKIFEKTQIKWFTFDDIQKNHNKFRTFYQNIINLILGKREAIENFVYKKIGESNISTTKRNYKKNKLTRKYKK
jgi:hypothetical protein